MNLAAAYCSFAKLSFHELTIFSHQNACFTCFMEIHANVTKLLLDSCQVETDQTDKRDECVADTASVFTATSKAVFSTPKPG